ncbi:hypothetical protein NW762_013252 [Fusarium torreyae]|uniref:Uncharacterized protein n=1 Tax=Fusarium torreyae TaxID=1237075 RepID=A0A9W8RPH7_9HYPO|nr:hypothetical protein NW762_013252 [Fusarium torreyae]
MAKLKSFSLAQHYQDPSLSILRSTISTVLEALPASCANLELAVGGAGADEIEGIDGHPTHLCENIRRLLPRMYHVHINLECLCDAMLGTWDPNQIFHPISLPKLRSLHVDCADYLGRRECRDEYHHTPERTWRSIIRGLQHVVDLRETGTPEVTVLGSSPAGRHPQQDIYQTLLRCHIRKGEDSTTTWAFPTPYMPPPNGNHVFNNRHVRINGGDFVALGRRPLHYIAGDRPWRILTNGSKLPATWDHHLPWISDEKVGLVAWEEWIERWPRKKSSLAVNEELTGMRLIEAEERKGYEVKSLVEKTPQGYARPTEAWNRARLFREGDLQLEPV